jgi:choline dehydrogenase
MAQNRKKFSRNAIMHANGERLGILYPRGATLGGSAQLNAMNFAIPPDKVWDHIAELTGDES